MLLADTVLPRGLSLQDEREAARALRGRMLRQEIYAEDSAENPDKADKPYLTTEQNFEVRLLQPTPNPRSADFEPKAKHAICFAHPCETVAIHSERNPSDPRVTHELVLEVDDFGNLKRKVAIAYRRAAGEPEQEKSWATLSESDFINEPGHDDWYRVGVECESRSFELTGFTFPIGGTALVTLGNLKRDIDALLPVDDLAFEASPTSGRQRRLLDRKQQLFYNNALTAPLALSTVESLALPYESYQLALTTGIVAQLSADSLELSGIAFDPVLLLTEGKYVQRDPNYWTASGRVIFDATKFYLPVESIDPFGNHFFAAYDAFSLLIESTRDPLDNLVQSLNDYRVLAPAQITDLNLNRTAVAFDALGMVIKTAVMGKAGAVPAEGDTLDEPTTRLEYEILRFQNLQKPNFAHTFAREQHGSSSPVFQETFAYSDGFGRIVMQKAQAEPAPGTTVPRWVGTGRTVFNNKGSPVKQYEPFFSATSDFEDEDDLVTTGVTPIIHYDPLGRTVRTELPDGTEIRVEFDVWQQRTFDPNDTVLASAWYTERGSPSPTGPKPSKSEPDRLAAWLAAQHAETPTLTHFDALGRPFLIQVDNGPDPTSPGSGHRLYDTRTEFDIGGNALSITDAQGVEVIKQRFDVLQRRLRVDSPDAGARLALANVADQSLRSWDARQQTMRPRYDALQRPTHLYVRRGSATERLLSRTVYGESLSLADAQTANLRGSQYQTYDCAGLATRVAYDFNFKGNALRTARRLATNYQVEPDWSAGEELSSPDAILAAVGALLELETFESRSTYDALNRIVTATSPDGSTQRPEYTEGNLLRALHVSVRGAPEQTVITALEYNARGQRTHCAHGNGTTSTYEYDPKNFRLTEVIAARSGLTLQHLTYTFDAIGNVVVLREVESAPVFSGTVSVSGDGFYEYDPLYRLAVATGREHPAIQPTEVDTPLGSSGIPHANDLQALQGYTESYTYDKVGNIQRVSHRSGPSGSTGWTRNYSYGATSNRLLATSVPGSELDLSEVYTYDQHGSMTSMPRLAIMEWDYADRLQHTRKTAGGAPQDTYFVYDAGGHRVRKVAVASGLIKERIYLGGYEAYRERSAAPGATIDFERQTLHLMDGERRVAVAETKTRESGSPPPSLETRWRYQLENHLGSATLETDDSGSIISYEEYHPFGTTAFRVADGASEVSAKRYRYTGKEKDEETGLYYYGARYYAPWLGRWTACDPLGLVDGTCVYQYAKNEPTNLVDPNGHQSGPWGPLIQLQRATQAVSDFVAPVVNSAPVQFAAGVVDAGADTLTGIATGARDRVVRTFEEVKENPGYLAGGVGGIATAQAVAETRHQVAEVKAKAAEQGGGARGWFVAVNQQLNPAYGIFEHGANAIEAGGKGDWRRAGAETTHTGTSALATLALAEGGAALAEGALARTAKPPTPKPHATKAPPKELPAGPVAPKQLPAGPPAPKQLTAGPSAPKQLPPGPPAPKQLPAGPSSPKQTSAPKAVQVEEGEVWNARGGGGRLLEVSSAVPCRTRTTKHHRD